MKKVNNSLFSSMSDAALTDASLATVKGGVDSEGSLDNTCTNYSNSPDCTDTHTGARVDSQPTSADMDTPSGS